MEIYVNIITSSIRSIVVIFLIYCLGCQAWFFNFKPDLLVTQQQVVTPDVAEPFITVLLVPSGDAHNQGRSLYHQFESSWTMAFIANLKAELENLYPRVSVVISHKTGEIIQPFQIVSMANDPDIDCVINIFCCKNQEEKPSLYLYYFSYGQDFVKVPELFSWCSMSNAYLFSKKNTHDWAKLMSNELSKYAQIFNLFGPYKMPFKPLLGIKEPAFGLEFKVKNDEDFKPFVGPIAAGIGAFLKPLIDQRTSRGVA